MNSIKDMIKDGKKVKFLYYKQNELWYVTECGFEFPVPTYDTGDGTFLAEDRAMFFMRYIRKHLNFLEEAKNETQDDIDKMGVLFDRPELQAEPLPEYTKPDPNIYKNPADFVGGPLEYPEDFDSTIE